MKLKFSFLILAMVTIFYNCSTSENSFQNEEESKAKKTTIKSLFGIAALPEQLFTIAINKNNRLVTKNGVVIQVPAGSLQSNSDSAQLQVQEAINMQDIVMANLHTSSNGSTLQSGGMIHIAAMDSNNIKIIMPLKVYIPTAKYNAKMQLYKGQKDTAGNINWVQPEPLKDEMAEALNKGEVLFKANCFSCHKMNKDNTGPALWNIQNRRSQKWLYAFVRNPAAVSSFRIETSIDASYNNNYTNEDAHKDYYYTACLMCCWKPTIMAGFPNLSDDDLKKIFTYIKNESNSHPEISNLYAATKCDSCATYKMMKDNYEHLQQEKQALVATNNKLFSVTRTFPPGNYIQQDVAGNGKVSIANTPSTYYEIEVNAFGWYNIDELLRNTKIDDYSNIQIEITDSQNTVVNINIIIPNKKIFAQGGLLSNSKKYGFYDLAGKTPIPTNEPCIVYAIAEDGQGNFLFGFTNFLSAKKSDEKINLKILTKEEVLASIAGFNLPDIKTEIKDSKNAVAIHKIDFELSKIELWKPKGCDCDYK
jgi:cytochrome c2